MCTDHFRSCAATALTAVQRHDPLPHSLSAGDICLNITATSSAAIISGSMTPTPPRPISAPSGVLQFATAAVLLTYLSFTTGWWFWITVGVAGALAISGSVLVGSASTTRRLPLKTLVETWMPMLPIHFAAFLVLFGAGLVFAEYGSSMIGILLITAGYGTFSAQTILKVARKLTR